MEIPLEKDKLYPRAALYRLGMEDEQIEEAIAAGKLCQRLQWGVEELWVDGQPHMRATRFSVPRTVTVTAPPPKATGGAILPKPKKAAPAKKQEQPKEVLSLGLGF